MTKPLPKWIMQKYAALWRQFRYNEFDHTQSTEILKDNTSVIISHLKKNGWIEIKLNPKDSRKRIYVLKTPEQAVQEIGMEIRKETA